MKISTKEMVLSALLVALSILIPFMSLPVVPVPEFSVTLFAHVPILISMFISPVVAVLTAIGTTLGFIIKGTALVVVMRAASHVVFAIVGALMFKYIKNKYNFVFIWLVTLVFHVVLEIAVVAFWFQTKDVNISLTIGAPTFAIHHTVDYVMAVIIYYALAKAKLTKK